MQCNIYTTTELYPQPSFSVASGVTSPLFSYKIAFALHNERVTADIYREIRIQRATRILNVSHY
jgi:hypothetical protein